MELNTSHEVYGRRKFMSAILGANSEKRGTHQALISEDKTSQQTR